MVEVKNLTKRYGAHFAVDNLSFTVGDGEMRFEANISDHGHLKCLKCGSIFDFAYPEGTVLPNPATKFKILSRYLYYEGFCPSCLT